MEWFFSTMTCWEIEEKLHIRGMGNDSTFCCCYCPNNLSVSYKSFLAAWESVSVLNLKNGHPWHPWVWKDDTVACIYICTHISSALKLRKKRTHSCCWSEWTYNKLAIDSLVATLPTNISCTALNKWTAISDIHLMGTNTKETVRSLSDSCRPEGSLFQSQLQEMGEACLTVYLFSAT